MKAEAVIGARMDNNTRAFLLGDKKRRNLDVIYTDYGTEIFVENGVLVEQVKDSGLDEISCSSPPSSPKSSIFPKEKLEEVDRKRNLDAALAALKYYNKKHKVDYELVEPLNNYGNCLKGGVWIHCNFTAKPRTSLLEGNENSSTKLFFAEMRPAGSNSSERYVANACRPLDGVKIVKGCEMCAESLLHPTHGFRKGRYKDIPRLLRRRRLR